MAQPAIGLNDRLHFLIITKKVLISKLSILIEEGVVKRQVLKCPCVRAHVLLCFFQHSFFLCFIVSFSSRFFLVCRSSRLCRWHYISGQLGEGCRVGRVCGQAPAKWFYNIFLSIFGNICQYICQFICQYISVTKHQQSDVTIFFCQYLPTVKIDDWCHQSRVF